MENPTSVALGDVVTDVVIETIYPAEEDGEYEEISTASPLTVLIEQNPEETDEFYNEHAYTVQAASRKRKNETKFLDKTSVLVLLLESESTVSKIPGVPEVNHYYLLDDDRNFFNGQRKSGRNTFNVDDHKWDSTSLKKHHYVLSNGEFKYVDFIGGQYLNHMPYAPGGKAKRQVMPRQPLPEEILIMRKLYGSIKGVMRRRISYIEKLPIGIEPKQRNLILVEYSEDKSEHDLPDAKIMKIEHCESDSDVYLVEAENGDGLLTQLETENIEETSSISLPSASILQLKSPNLEEIENHAKKDNDNKGVLFDKNEAIELLLNSTTSLEEIPEGVKENEYFLINNEDNYQRSLEGKRRTYVDDCGVWKNVSMKKHLYTRIGDKYVYVDFVDNKYKISNSALRAKYGKDIGQSQVLVMRKVYGSLKRDENYKRRICWIDEFPENVFPKQENIALVEYIGRYPKEEAPHGNQKQPGGSPYVRTSAKLMKAMKAGVAHKTAKEVIKEIGLDDNPKYVKQLQNLRYRSNLKISAGSANNQAHNDEIQQILSMVHGHPYVQQCICTKNKPPVIIAYTPQQMNSWKYRCQERSGLDRVLGIDRTISIGPICLTILTYPHPNLLCRKTSKLAVMMGPVFIHVDKSCQTYSFLFNHIKGCLLNADKADIDGISVACKPEEEKPIIEALNFSFPATTVTLCIDHMKDDLRNHLVSEICVPAGIAENIIKEIFSGLWECAEDYDFDMKVLHLQSQYDGSIPQFGLYFRKLVENIRHSVWRPTLDGRPLHKWSVESCEALGQVIESAESCIGTASKIPEILSKLYTIVQEQERNEILALHDEGNFVLAPHSKKYLTTKCEWQLKTNKQRVRLAESLRKIRPGVHRTATKPKSDLPYRTSSIVGEAKDGLLYRSDEDVQSYY